LFAKTEERLGAEFYDCSQIFLKTQKKIALPDQKDLDFTLCLWDYLASPERMIQKVYVAMNLEEPK
jgi:hypothetical protein